MLRSKARLIAEKLNKNERKSTSEIVTVAQGSSCTQIVVTLCEIFTFLLCISYKSDDAGISLNKYCFLLFLMTC